MALVQGHVHRLNTWTTWPTWPTGTALGGVRLLLLLLDRASVVGQDILAWGRCRRLLLLLLLHVRHLLLVH